MDEFTDPPMPGAPKKPAIPIFKTVPVQMEFASAQAGRPIFEDREFVTIVIPGDRNAMAHEPVREEHRNRWPKEYEAFKAGKETPLEGTPLAEWPGMIRARVEELAYFHIRTVEELAGLNDAQLQKIGMGARAERDKARLFLDAARNGSAPLERMVAKNLQLELETERLTRDLQAAQAEIRRLQEAQHASVAT